MERRDTDVSSRYNKFSRYLIDRYGEKVWKIPVDAGLRCPNRDPGRGREGCLFCRVDSFSRTFAEAGAPLEEQIQAGIRTGRTRFGINRFIVYFQASTNTFAPVEFLREIFYRAIEHEHVVGLSIATRPDCLPEAVLELLSGLARTTDLWIELGLQSFDDDVLRMLNRGHTVEDYFRAVNALSALPLRICTHLMFGLPSEDAGSAARQIRVHEVKCHPLLLLHQTPMADLYRRGEIEPLTLDQYVHRICDFLERIPAETVIQRLTAEAPAEQLIAPNWAGNKLAVLNRIEAELERRDSRQGCYC